MALPLSKNCLIFQTISDVLGFILKNISVELRNYVFDPELIFVICPACIPYHSAGKRDRDYMGEAEGRAARRSPKAA